MARPDFCRHKRTVVKVEACRGVVSCTITRYNRLDSDTPCTVSIYKVGAASASRLLPFLKEGVYEQPCIEVTDSGISIETEHIK